MIVYRPEASADLEFSFPEDLVWEELDRQGIKLPVLMKFVDLVIERENDVLLVEVKDPSHTRAPAGHRENYFKRLLSNSVVVEELTPKARCSYTFLHLMKRDTKPFKFVILLGLDGYSPAQQRFLLTGFKDRLEANIQCEADSPWKRQYISECLVLSVELWNKQFPKWLVKRLGNTAGDDGKVK